MWRWHLMLCILCALCGCTSSAELTFTIEGNKDINKGSVLEIHVIPYGSAYENNEKATTVDPDDYWIGKKKEDPLHKRSGFVWVQRVRVLNRQITKVDYGRPDEDAFVEDSNSKIRFTMSVPDELAGVVLLSSYDNNNEQRIIVVSFANAESGMMGLKSPSPKREIKIEPEQLRVVVIE